MELCVKEINFFTVNFTERALCNTALNIGQILPDVIVPMLLDDLKEEIISIFVDMSLNCVDDDN